MKRYGIILLTIALLMILSPLRFPASAATSGGIDHIDGALSRDIGAKVDWDGCNCKESATAFTIDEGTSLPARVTIPSIIASHGIAGAKSGDKLYITWQGRDKWLVYHSNSGKTFTWRWQIPVLMKQ